MSTELTKTDFNVFTVLESAVQKGIDPDGLTKLVDLQERIAKSEAEQAYNAAMKAAQSEMPKIVKAKVNKQTGSMYADLGDINIQITPVYTKHGFSLSFSEGTAKREEDIRIVCICAHEKGHARESFIDLPIDNVGLQGKPNKTIIHGTGSTFSYGQRYLIKLLFNLSIDEEDDDGQAAGEPEYKKKLYEEGKTAGCEMGKLWYKHREVIEAIKDRLADEDYLAAAEAYFSLSNQEQTAMNRAPTKGGIFTKEEVEKMRSSEWNAVRQQAIELNDPELRSM